MLTIGVDDSGRGPLIGPLILAGVLLNEEQEKILKYLNNSKNLVIRCEHKADRDYVAVSAASVLAKCAREEEVAKIKKEYGNIGSGYPADPITAKFLKENGEKLRNSSIFRKSWATWKKMFPGEKQRTLAL